MSAPNVGSRVGSDLRTELPTRRPIARVPEGGSHLEVYGCATDVGESCLTVNQVSMSE